MPAPLAPGPAPGLLQQRSPARVDLARRQPAPFRPSARPEHPAKLIRPKEAIAPLILRSRGRPCRRLARDFGPLVSKRSPALLVARPAKIRPPATPGFVAWTVPAMRLGPALAS